MSTIAEIEVGVLVRGTTGRTGKVTMANPVNGEYQIKWNDLPRELTYIGTELGRMLQRGHIKVINPVNTMKVISIIEMYMRGYSIRQIAAYHKVAYNTVHYHLRSSGVRFRPRGGCRLADRLPDPAPVP